jgi:hypothetical protein
MENMNGWTWANDSLGTPMYVSISVLGIALNQVSIKSLGSPEKVMIGYNEDLKILGILPVRDNLPQKAKSYTLVTPERKKMAWIRIGCKGFVRYLAKETGFNFEENTYKGIGEIEEGMLVLKLDMINEK